MKKSFTITCPPHSFAIALAMGIVYDTYVGFETLAFLFVLSTIVENFL